MKRHPRSLRRAAGVVLVVGLAVSLLWLLPAGLAYAHASLVRADPAPGSVVAQAPERVRAWFSEPLEAGFSTIQVLDARGRRVDKDDSAVDARQPTSMSVAVQQPLSEGRYTVVWTSLSAVDGHPLRGAYVFSVGEPPSDQPPAAQPGQPPAVQPGPPLVQSPLEPLSRWLVLLGGLTLLGGLGFELLVLRPAFVGRSSSEAARRLGTLLSSRSAKLLWVAWGLFALASVGQLLVQAMVASGLPWSKAIGSPLFSVLRGTKWGDVWQWRMEWLAVAAFVLAIMGRPRPVDQGQEEQPAIAGLYVRVLALVTTAGALFTLSWTSHGAALQHVRAQAVLSDYLHLLAAGFWVGGLFHLALGLPLVLRTLSPAERGAVLSAIVPRFSALAVLSVGTLVITGLYSSWAQVTVLRALDTPYGLTLLVKVGLLVPLLGLAALNLLWVRPRLAREKGAGRWLLRFVIGEAALATLLLLSVGLLASLEPAREVASRRVAAEQPGHTFQRAVEGTTIALEIRPGLVGANRFLIALNDRLGNPIVNATEVSLRLTYLDAEVEPAVLSATNLGGGRYAVEAAQLDIAGAWEAFLTVRRPDAFDARTAVRFEATAAGLPTTRAITPSPDTGKILWVAQLALLGIVFLGTGVVLGGRASRGGTAVMAIGAVAVVVAMALVASRGLGVQRLPANPVPATETSLTQGKALYGQYCLSCHGATGRGDGPQAARLDPNSLDLTAHVPLHSDGELHRFITKGIPGTAMYPWKGAPGTDEVWHVVNYLRTLPASANR